MTMVASLGMYDHPAQRVANDQLWSALAEALCKRGVRDVPNALDRDRPVQEIWRDPKLLFGQICGFPLISDQTLELRVLTLPVYDVPGCYGDTHCSFVVARSSDGDANLADYRGRHAAINSTDSNSGMNLFRAEIASISGGAPFFGSVMKTGSHRDSIRAIVAGEADLAAVDVVTYAALEHFEPELTAPLRVLTRTQYSPTLPFVTGQATDPQTVAALQSSLREVLADPALADARATLFLTGVTGAVEDRFAPLLQLQRDAALAGYPELY